jgi:hypothetical protein
VLVIIALTVAACGSGAPASVAPSSTDPAPTSDANQPAESEAPPSTAAEPPAGGGGQDGSSIDWATVDLTTIDWATIDLGTVDWQAIEDNPTATNVSEEDQALIQSRIFLGRATLTLGGDTSDGESQFRCAEGHEATESDVYSFSSGAEVELGGLRVIVEFDVRDESGTGQVSGDVVYEIEIHGGSLTNPELSWAMTSADAVTIDGRNVSVSGTFDDLLTEGAVEAAPGTFIGECGDLSRF